MKKISLFFLFLAGFIGGGIISAYRIEHKSLLKDEYLYYRENNRFCGFYKDKRTNKTGIVWQKEDLYIMTPAIFEDCYKKNPNKTQMLIVKKDGKWGAFDGDFEGNTFGEFTVPFMYDFMRPFDSNDHAIVTLNGETFKIDKYNNRVHE